MRFVLLTILTVVAFTVTACGSGDTQQVATDAPGTTLLLPRDFVLPLSQVQVLVPEMAAETATGLDESALGSPTGSRSVTFSSANRQQHLVLSVARYISPAAASAAFSQAVEGSLAAPGGDGQLVSGLGQQAFIGSSRQGDETHVGGGALFNDLIITATLQAFPPTQENKNKVIEIIRQQAAADQGR